MTRLKFKKKIREGVLSGCRTKDFAVFVSFNLSKIMCLCGEEVLN